MIPQPQQKKKKTETNTPEVPPSEKANLGVKLINPIP